MTLPENASYGAPPACPLPKDRLARIGIIQAWLPVLIPPGNVFECRQHKVMERGFSNTYGSFFDTEHFRLCAVGATSNEDKAGGTYWTLNALHQDCLAVRKNKWGRIGKGESAQDENVIRRTWLLIDADPERKPSGISANDAEKAHAWQTINAVKYFLASLGWPAGILADSGNGFHQLLRIDLPTDDSGLVERVLKALAHRFTNKHVKIDQGMFTPSHICKLYGTWARKGDEIPGRPHRLSWIIEIPGCADPLKPATPAIDVVSKDLLEALAAEFAPPPSQGAGTAQRSSPPTRQADRAGEAAESTGEFKPRLDVARWLRDRGIESNARPRNAKGWLTWHIVCPFNPEHKNTDCYIGQNDKGALSGHCSHDSCSGRRWDDFKEAIGRPDPEHYDPPLQRRRKAPQRQTATSHARAFAVQAIGESHELQPGFSANGDGHADDDQSADGLPTVPNEADDDPHRLARLSRNKRYDHADGATLLFYRDEYHAWDGCAYRRIPGAELRALLTRDIKEEFDRINLLELAGRVAKPSAAEKEEGPPQVVKVTKGLVTNVMNALADLSLLSSRIEAPAWLDGRTAFTASEVLACRNGLVHLPSFADDLPDHFCSHTPAFFSPNCLDFDFGPNSDPPSAWLEFVEKLWPDDHESIDALQEWMGYLLTPDTRQQKIAMLVGPKRSGKGTIARVIRGLVGSDNIAAPTLSSLGTNFGLWPLVGKTVAIISDARLGGKTDVATLTERLLSVSGEDAQTVDRKNLPHWTGKLSTRFMVLTNELPNLADASGALTSRVILFRLAESWYGREDTRLSERLLTELPGILLWAISGWQRLQSRGHLVQPSSALDLLEEMCDLSSPVSSFVKDHCHVAPGGMIAKLALFDAWKNWCAQQGRDHPGSMVSFGIKLMAALPMVTATRPRVDGGREHFYEGICLK